MPILPENKHRYPKNWKEIRENILIRAGQVRDVDGKVIQEALCEFCKSENHGEQWASGATVVLTIAHLDHTPENCNDDNLRALCQMCHNQWDAPVRAKNRKVRKWCKRQITSVKLHELFKT